MNKTAPQDKTRLSFEQVLYSVSARHFGRILLKLLGQGQLALSPCSGGTDRASTAHVLGLLAHLIWHDYCTGTSRVLPTQFALEYLTSLVELR